MRSGIYRVICHMVGRPLSPRYIACNGAASQPNFWPRLMHCVAEHRSKAQALGMQQKLSHVRSWVSCRAPDRLLRPGHGGHPVSRRHGCWGQSTLFRRYKTGRANEESLKPTKSVQAIRSSSRTYSKNSASARSRRYILCRGIWECTNRSAVVPRTFSEL